MTTYCVNFHVGVVDSASTIFSVSHTILSSPSVRVSLDDADVEGYDSQIVLL